MLIFKVILPKAFETNNCCSFSFSFEESYFLNQKSPISNQLLAQNTLKLLRLSIHQRLFGDLEVNNSQTGKILNYKPEYNFDQGIREMIEWYKKNRDNKINQQFKY